MLPKVVNFVYCPCAPPLLEKFLRVTMIDYVGKVCVGPMNPRKEMQSITLNSKLKTRCCCFETAHLKFHLTNDVLAVTIVLGESVVHL